MNGPRRHSWVSSLARPFAAALAAFVGAAGASWIAWRASRLRRHARPLTDSERARHAAHLSQALLESVRVARVPTVRLGRLAAIAASLFPRVLARPVGIALADLVVLGAGADHPADHDADPRAVLFHELVHVAQFRILGVPGFCHAYIRGWALARCCYADIPLERDAYELQAWFLAGRAFAAEAEVARRIASRR